jgi:hypothetical protein
MAVSTLYCGDEAILIRASSDYALLVPDSNRMAYGSDGVFDSSDRWTLASASSDFASQGVAAGHVCILSQPGVRSSRFGSDGEPFIVSSTAMGLTLRRPGFADGLGDPPGASGGMTGVSFKVVSFKPQIEDASYRINIKFNIDEFLPGRKPSDLYDQREIERLCVLTVLYDRYLDAWRRSMESQDLWRAKAAAIDREIRDIEGSLSLKWGANAEFPPTNKFSTRISR